MRLLGLLILLAASCFAQDDQPRFNDKGELLLPANYREWVFLSSGLGMTYGPNAAAALDNPMFDNVYVTPSAFRAFKETGKWPHHTMFVLEIRYSTSQGSINKGGFYQTDLAAVEVALKDEKRFPETTWAYFDFGGGLTTVRKSSAALGPKASCYACHSTNGAVENTFTQFYPLALEVAQAKGVVKSTYQPPVDSPVKLFETLRTKGWQHAETILASAKAKDPNALILREGMLNRIGYQATEQGRRDDAIEVFKYAAAAFPNSANARDSLAEAYEGAGKTALAVAETERALAMLDQSQDTPERKDRIRKSLTERLARLKKPSQ